MPALPGIFRSASPAHMWLQLQTTLNETHFAIKVSTANHTESIEAAVQVAKARERLGILDDRRQPNNFKKCSGTRQRCIVLAKHYQRAWLSSTKILVLTTVTALISGRVATDSAL
jgi:hypothetical protein